MTLTWNPYKTDNYNLPEVEQITDQRVKYNGIKTTILKLQPLYHKNPKQLEELTVALDNYSEKYNICWKLATAIFFQESSLLRDPQNCYKKPANCTGDRGISQINYRVWGKLLKIDKKRLLLDVDYAVHKGFKVLKIYKERHKNEQNWYSRYHSGTPRFRKAYEKRILKILEKIENI